MLSDLTIDYLLRQAHKRHGNRIRPAGTAKNWRESVTVCDITNTVNLWYNAPGDKSTHNIILEKEKNNETAFAHM